MKISKKEAELRSEKMTAKPNCISAIMVQDAPCHVWMNNSLEFDNYLMFNRGTLTYAKGTIFRTNAGNSERLHSARFSGKHRLLVEEENGICWYFNKERTVPEEFSLIMSFRHIDKVVLLVADRNFSARVQCLVFDATPDTEKLCISTMWGLIAYRNSEIAEVMDQWLKNAKYPLGKNH